MKINREELLNILESVSPGIAQRELIEQSSCLVFHNGNVCTFNEEIACFRKSPLKLEGAIKAAPFLALLNKLTADNIDIEIHETELLIKEKRKKAKLTMEAKVSLPIEDIEPPETWTPLDPEFFEAVKLVHPCASTGGTGEFYMECVHITPEYLEASDYFQVARYQFQTGIEETLVRAETIKKLIGYDMTEISETSSWLHFRNPVGMIMSIRKHIDKYPSIGKFIKKGDTVPVEFPKGIEEIAASAEIFSIESADDNLLTIDLKNDRIIVEGRGVSGWYKEMQKINYKGEPVKFRISPKLLVEVAKKANECGIGENRLFVNTGKFRYATPTMLGETDG